MVLLLFGATGDLAKRMLLPSLFGLDVDGLLAASMQIVGTARRKLDDAAFREIARTALTDYVDAERLLPDRVAGFLERLRYVPLDATDAAGFAPLAGAVGATNDLSIFLSTAPSLFGSTIAGLAAAGLAGPSVRLALEKPLGADLASSRAINDQAAADWQDIAARGRGYRLRQRRRRPA